MKAETFRKSMFYFWFYNLLVILWGAWVRISRSGDGCGENWPLCHGEFVPTTTDVSTWIEFSHRLSTGLYGIVVLILTVFCFKTFPKGHIVRKIIPLVLFFTLTEALIGARLVLAGLVGDNATLARAYMMGVHQVNSLLLTGSILLGYFYATSTLKQFSPDGLARKPIFFWLVSLAFIIIATTGAFAALSGTLYPSASLISGLIEDLNKDSHVLVKLRIWHPLLSTLLSLFIGGCVYILSLQSKRPEIIKRTKAFLFSLPVAILFGAGTLFALSPNWMKITHLAIAHALWSLLLIAIAPVLFGKLPVKS